MKILFLGDIVGRDARHKIYDILPDFIQQNHIDFTIINAENAASGFGITKKIFTRLIDAGADAITLGNHTWDNKEIYQFIDAEPRLIRPANYPEGTPGKGASVIKARNGKEILVVNLLGQVFMHPTLACPFATIDQTLEYMQMGHYCDVAIVDFHAEATSEKQAMGHYLDGRVSMVVGTHTHVPTADERILSGGTAYQTDAGMCGVYDSILGMEKQEPIARFTTKLNSQRYKPQTGHATLTGNMITVNEQGLAETIERVKIN